MKKLIISVVLFSLVLPVYALAQDDESGAAQEKREIQEPREISAGIEKEEVAEKREVTEEQAIPEPLGTEWDWMIGEWEGMVESPMGTSKEWEKVKYSLDRQFIVIHTKSDYGNMIYQGTGYMTSEPGSDKLIGFWFDNMRGIYKGSGKKEGNTSTMTWSGKGNRSTRYMEKLSDDKYSLTVKWDGPDGKMMEAKGEYNKISKPAYKQDVIRNSEKEER
ncbi:MAG: hypothetical protein V2J62_02075 [candidate division KSB1 bacterium]|jgi:hypothetical protein|nr:hypothetical protein [candidate division KSB1 bacterium]